VVRGKGCLSTIIANMSEKTPVLDGHEFLLQPEVVFEDQDLLVLNKPAGLVVNRASSVKQVTLQDWIDQYFAKNPDWEKGRGEDEVFAQRSGMIHRLDKDTSGLILFAKRPEVMYQMMEQFQARTVQKTYLALAHEHFSDPEGIIEVGIRRHPQDRERFSVSSEGRPSKTHYRVQREFSGIDIKKLQEDLFSQGKDAKGIHQLSRIYQGFSLVELQPKTGRTHQIRVHLQFLHHPIVGDERYVGRKRYRIDQFWCPRQWLHAWKIAFSYPAGGPPREYVAPIAADLEKSLQFLTD